MKTSPLQPSATKPDRIRILIVDDNEIVRQGIRQWLEDCLEFKIIGEAGDGLQALALAGNELPDIVLMDISMPRMNGIEATAWLKKRFPQVRVIMHSVSTKACDVRRALAAGADAYLVKASNARLALVIHEVAAGRTFIDPTVTEESVPNESDRQ